MKLVWYVGEKATGRYRSFHKRSWPACYIDHRDGPMVASISAESGEGYRPNIAETEVLIVRVAQPKGHTFEWRRLKARPQGVGAAKILVDNFFRANPSWLTDRKE